MPCNITVNILNILCNKKRVRVCKNGQKTYFF